MKAIVTGSFDPITVGHADLIKRASQIFDEVYAVMFINPDKEYYFSFEKRLEMLKTVCGDMKNVTVDSSLGYVVDYCAEHGIGIIVRGIRDAEDLKYETEMAEMNHTLNPDVETLFLPAKPELVSVSSTGVREAVKNGEATSDAPWCSPLNED